MADRRGWYVRAILFFVAVAVVWGLLELFFGFTLGQWLLRLVVLARRGGV
jgi:hypothetical protein